MDSTRATLASFVLVLVSLLMGCADELPTSPLLDTGKTIPIMIQNMAGEKGGPLHSAGILEVTLSCNTDPSLCERTPMRIVFSEGEESEIVTFATFSTMGQKKNNVTHGFTTPPRARKVTVILYADRTMTREVTSGARTISGPERGELFFAWDLEAKRLVWASRGFEQGSCIALGQWAGVLAHRTGSEPVTCRGIYKLSCYIGRQVETREVDVLSGD